MDLNLLRDAGVVGVFSLGALGGGLGGSGAWNLLPVRQPRPEPMDAESKPGVTRHWPVCI